MKLRKFSSIVAMLMLIMVLAVGVGIMKDIVPLDPSDVMAVFEVPVEAIRGEFIAVVNHIEYIGPALIAADRELTPTFHLGKINYLVV